MIGKEDYEVDEFPLDDPECDYCHEEYATCRIRIYHIPTKKYVYIPSCEDHKGQIGESGKRAIQKEIELRI